MASLLIAYGTTDGHTAKIANALAQTLRTCGADVDVFDTGATTTTQLEKADQYAAVIVAASVHAGGYQGSVVRWVQERAAALKERPTAFVSVCLGVLQHEPEVDRELAGIAQRFFDATGWTPTIWKSVAGALLYRQYDPIKRWMMRRIVAKAHGDTDTSRNYEYTDWDALNTFGKAFWSEVSDKVDDSAYRQGHPKQHSSQLP
jgi:menaquinone-dependent protoporphyrinogen oxidase